MSVYRNVNVGADSVRSGTGTHQLAAASSGPAPPPSRKRKEWGGSGLGGDDDDPDARANFSSFLLRVPFPPHVRPPPPLLPPAEQRPVKQQLPSPRHAPVPAVTRQPAAPGPANSSAPPTKPSGNRILMAGYLAHEFLSRGTLLGRPFGAATAATHAATTRKEEMQRTRKQQYEEVARIMWGGGVHVPGVINPSLLGGWLQKQHQ